MEADVDLDFLAKKFEIPGNYVSSARYGAGHINDTFVAVYEHDGRRTRYIHQRLNTGVFSNPVALMENVSRVVAHLARRARRSASGADAGPVLELIPATGGGTYFDGGETGFWRTFSFIEGTKSLDVIETPAQAREAAAAIGRFQLALADLPPPRLNETIADFHHTPTRFERLLRALAADVMGRAGSCRVESEFARTRSALALTLTGQIDRGLIPERIAHNDTKLNNVLLDIQTGRGVCVIDLDTVMPGSVLYDFGDMVRTATMTVPEDEPDLSQVCMDRTLFEALVDGYVSSTVGWLNDAEKSNLVLSGRVMAFEVGIRFLTDYLNGDEYFKTEFPEQNLARCRTQFALLRDMEANADLMEGVVRQSLATQPAME